MTLPVDEQPRIDALSDDHRSDGPKPPDHDVFVSYSTRDKPVADAVVSRLEQANIRCWVAPRDVLPGMVWAEAIIAAIATSRIVVVVLSGAAIDSPQVNREVERAVAGGAVVVPFRIDSVEPTGAMAYYLAGEHWLDAMSPPLESHIAQLVRVVRALLDRAPVPAAGVAAAFPSAPVPAPATAAAGEGGSMRTWLLVAAGVLGTLGIAAVLGLFSGFFTGDTGASPSPVAAASDSAAPTATPGVSSTPVPTMAPTPTPAPTPSDDGGTAGIETSVFDLEVGDCFSEGAQSLSSVFVVGCGQPHIYEVFSVLQYDADATAAYPGDASMMEEADSLCRVPFPGYVGTDYATSAYWITTIAPSSSTWAEGDREIVCTLRFGEVGEEVSGSAAGSGQ